MEHVGGDGVEAVGGRGARGGGGGRGGEEADGGGEGEGRVLRKRRRRRGGGIGWKGGLGVREEEGGGKVRWGRGGKEWRGVDSRGGWKVGGASGVERRLRCVPSSDCYCCCYCCLEEAWRSRREGCGERSPRGKRSWGFGSFREPVWNIRSP